MMVSFKEIDESAFRIRNCAKIGVEAAGRAQLGDATGWKLLVDIEIIGCKLTWLIRSIVYQTLTLQVN